ncbi:glycoside hydrolase family 36 protein [Dactylosporangium sp. AC04546]|uniref:glycoside hydrolase family 36 protein n=1 Tax=Dactylosporangium sp. AC04546 TaxID=2862460 RepID=UPI001EDCC08D|nr:glycoside hydrolase family 36 protein [Dactylosporangium sp. AC04546]WVK81285.1 glycoside hydrolase family 36 protein [Dactylosporangium sp. AC04546]
MAQLVELGGRSFALQHSGQGAPRPVPGGVLLPPGRVAVLHGLDDASFYRHGQNSWSPCGWRPLSQPPLRVPNPTRLVTADDPAFDDPSRHHSSAVAALHGADGSTLLLGALGLDTPRLVADRDTLTGWYATGGADWFLAHGDEQEVFAAYAAQLAERFGVRGRRAGNVWCSWYAYYENVTEAQLAKDVADLAGLPFDVVQIDDGWEEKVGDWVPNAKFPSGMRSLADRIADAGFTPGLWLAPFIALPNSRLATERPELLLRSASGQPVVAGYNWGGPYYALDLTLPAALEHVADLIRTVVHEWGFKYLKLDFINAAAAYLPGRHREQVYRDGLALIREVAGDDVYLLGSGAILLPSLGLLDGLRSGPDVAPMWDNYASVDPSDATARNAVVNSVHRLWQSPLVEVDPDVVYFRSKLNLLTSQQLRWLRDLADVCGFRAVSDPPSWLTPAELEDLREYLDATPAIRQLSRYRFTVDGREVDFGPAVAAGTGDQLYPIS